MVDVEAGYTFACAIGVDGQVRCAEDPSSAGYRGMLYGPRNWIAGSEPAGNDFIRLAAANERACALHASGEVVCWGFDGDDTPGVLPGPGRADFTSIYMLPDTYCGMTSDGYFCWGQDWRVVDNSPAVVGAVP